MMYINQNQFNLNDLIMTSQSSSTGFNLLPTTTVAATTTTATNSNFQQQNYQPNTSQSNNRSTSVSSTGSTSSSSSSSSQSSSTASTQLPNSLYPYSYAYYNPALTTYASNSTNQATNSQMLQNSTGITASLTASVLNSPSLSTASYPLNEKFLYRPKSDINNGILNSYQLNVLSQKNPNQFNFNSQASSIVNNDLNGSNLLMFNASKNAQNKQNYCHYEPTIAYLPTSTELYFTSSTVDQSPFNTNYLTAPFLTTSLAQTGLATKSLIHSASTFSTKTPFTATSVGINIKKRKRRFKKPLELRKVLPKNSLMLLHEYRPNVEYRFVCQSGPIHRPVFTMCVEINEHKFEGEGKTKKEARMSAAEKAIEFLMQNPEYIHKSTNTNSSSSSSSISSPGLNQKSDKDKNDLNSDDEDEDDNENDEQLNDCDDDDFEEEEAKKFKKKDSHIVNEEIKNNNLKLEMNQEFQVVHENS